MKNDKIYNDAGEIIAKKTEDGKIIRLCFRLTVDGKKYGPYLWDTKHKFKGLLHGKGVIVETMWLTKGWFVPPKHPRLRKDKSTPLLDGTGFIPVAKG